MGWGKGSQSQFYSRSPGRSLPSQQRCGQLVWLTCEQPGPHPPLLSSWELAAAWGEAGPSEDALPSKPFLRKAPAPLCPARGCTLPQSDVPVGLGSSGVCCMLLTLRGHLFSGAAVPAESCGAHSTGVHRWALGSGRGSAEQLRKPLWCEPLSEPGHGTS